MASKNPVASVESQLALMDARIVNRDERLSIIRDDIDELLIRLQKIEEKPILQAQPIPPEIYAKKRYSFWDDWGLVIIFAVYIVCMLLIVSKPKQSYVR